MLEQQHEMYSCHMQVQSLGSPKEEGSGGTYERFLAHRYPKFFKNKGQQGQGTGSHGKDFMKEV